MSVIFAGILRIETNTTITFTREYEIHIESLKSLYDPPYETSVSISDATSIVQPASVGRARAVRQLADAEDNA